MSQKRIIILAIVIILVAVGLSWWLFAHNQPRTVYHTMSGHISKVSNRSIEVRGSLTGDTKSSIRMIEFIITPKTVLAKRILLIPKSAQNIRISDPFVPIITRASGSFENFTVGMPIIKIETKSNLSRTTRVDAIRVEYQVFQYEK